MSALKVRKPTGQVAYPLLLVEGPEKSGKSYAAYQLASSAKVGRTFVADLGEGTADEYAELGPYEILDHNGTFSSLLDQLKAAVAVPQSDGKPNVIVLDDGTALWDLIKDWTGDRARRSKKGKETLKNDPDAEIDVPMNLWNDAKDRWYDVLNLLRGWPGIAVIIARGKEVTQIHNGQPVLGGRKEWRVEVEKSTTFAVSAWVRMARPHTATLIAARSLHLDVPDAGLALPAECPLEHLIFDVLGSGGFVASRRIVPTVGMDRATAKTRLLGLVEDAGYETPTARTMAAEMWKTTGNPEELTEEGWTILAEVARVRLAEALAARLAATGARPPTPITDDETAAHVPQEGSPPPTPPETPDRGQDEQQTPDPEGLMAQLDAVQAKHAGQASADRHAAETIAAHVNGDEVLDATIAEVKGMGAQDVVERLKEAGLPTSGRAGDRQTRLVAHLVEERSGQQIAKDVPE